MVSCWEAWVGINGFTANPRRFTLLEQNPTTRHSTSIVNIAFLKLRFSNSLLSSSTRSSNSNVGHVLHWRKNEQINRTHETTIAIYESTPKWQIGYKILFLLLRVRLHLSTWSTFPRSFEMVALLPVPWWTLSFFLASTYVFTREKGDKESTHYVSCLILTLFRASLLGQVQTSFYRPTRVRKRALFHHDEISSLTYVLCWSTVNHCSYWLASLHRLLLVAIDSVNLQRTDKSI